MFLVVIGIVVYLIGFIGLLIDEFKEHVAWGASGLVHTNRASVFRRVSF